MLNLLGQLRISAYFKDVYGERASAELLMLGHFSPENKQLKVSTSTSDPKVIFHLFIIYNNFNIVFNILTGRRVHNSSRSKQLLCRKI